MLPTNSLSVSTLPRDLTSGLVVFLVALPLCLGVALASNAPLFSGLLAGIVGGILVGMLSGSHTSVSGPAAGLTAIVAAQIVSLGSFPAFLLAVVLAGLIQVGLGLARAGFIASFFPSSVIKGLLAAIGVILILNRSLTSSATTPTRKGTRRSSNRTTRTRSPNWHEQSATSTPARPRSASYRLRCWSSGPGGSH